MSRPVVVAEDDDGENPRERLAAWMTEEWMREAMLREAAFAAVADRCASLPTTREKFLEIACQALLDDMRAYRTELRKRLESEWVVPIRTWRSVT